MEPVSQPLTYDEAAALLGVLPETVRRLARLKHWRRLPGNDGKARIIIPPDVLAAAQESVGGEKGGRRGGKPGRRRGRKSRAARGADAGAATLAEPRVKTAAALTALAEHLARLGRELDTLRIVADAAREEGAAARAAREELALEVTALRSTLALVEAERDRWCREAGRSVLSRLFGRRAA